MSDVPEIPVDEALELFLALTFPNGFPEGVDRDQLIAQMRARIARDRPEWAAASNAVPPPPPASYSEVKAAAVEKAQQPDLPSDPQERYLEERRREADEHREQRQEEARIAEARAELVRRLLARKREADTGRREEPLQFQAEPPWTFTPGPVTSDTQVPPLEPRQTFELGVPVAGPLARPEVDHAPAAAPRTSLPLSGPELAKVLRELTPDEQLAVLRGFGESRRALLKRREDLLADRRPSRNTDRGEPLEFSETDHAPARRERLRVEV